MRAGIMASMLFYPLLPPGRDYIFSNCVFCRRSTSVHWNQWYFTQDLYSWHRCLATLGEIKKEAFGLGAEEFNCICLLRDGQVHKREQMNFICLLMEQILSAFPCVVKIMFSHPLASFCLLTGSIHPQFPGSGETEWITRSLLGEYAS